MSRRPLHAAGYTLVELMIVVAIVGILAISAGLAMRRERDTAEVAEIVAMRVGECIRIASIGGSIRANVAATGLTARARLVIEKKGTQQQIVVEKLVEDPLPLNTAAWEQVSSTLTGEGLRVHGTRDEAMMTASSGPTTLIGVGSATLNCYPDGTTESRTFYIKGDIRSDPYKVAVLSLSGQALPINGW